MVLGSIPTGHFFNKILKLTFLMENEAAPGLEPGLHAFEACILPFDQAADGMTVGTCRSMERTPKNGVPLFRGFGVKKF